MISSGGCSNDEGPLPTRKLTRWRPFAPAEPSPPAGIRKSPPGKPPAALSDNHGSKEQLLKPSLTTIPDVRSGKPYSSAVSWLVRRVTWPFAVSGADFDVGEEMSALGRDDRIERVADHKEEPIGLKGRCRPQLGFRQPSGFALVRQSLKQLALSVGQGGSSRLAAAQLAALMA